MGNRFKGGKKAAEFHAGIPQAHHYLGLLPRSIPDKRDWSAAMGAVPILGNDQCGDCGIATSLHAIQLWTANAGTKIEPDTACAIADYSAITGYNPANGANDTGVVLLQKNQYWMQTGFAVDGRGALDRLDGFAQIRAGDLRSIRRSIAFFGCAEVGVLLPDDAEDEFLSAHAWTKTDLPPNPEGGHDILAVGYDEDTFTIATWNGFVRATNGWMAKYMDEGTMLLRREWLRSSGVSPSGMDMAALDAQIRAANGVLGLGAT